MQSICECTLYAICNCEYIFQHEVIFQLHIEHRLFWTKTEYVQQILWHTYDNFGDKNWRTDIKYAPFILATHLCKEAMKTVGTFVSNKVDTIFRGPKMKVKLLCKVEII